MGITPRMANSNQFDLICIIGDIVGLLIWKMSAIDETNELIKIKQDEF